MRLRASARHRNDSTHQESIHTMGQFTTLAAADGFQLSAYVAEPAGQPRGAIVVLQEIFGVNSHIRSVADRFAAEGYLAVAPATFDRVKPGVELGYTEDDMKAGFELKTAVEALPGAANVIPGEVHFTIDVRSGSETRRNTVAEAILARLREIAEARALELDIALVHDLAASPYDPALMDLMDEALVAAGQPVRRLVSGAGHDAMVMAALCPTAMLFIRCKDGISHNPAEHVEPADVEIALQVMLGFIDRLGQSWSNSRVA